MLHLAIAKDGIERNNCGNNDLPVYLRTDPILKANITVFLNFKHTLQSGVQIITK